MNECEELEAVLISAAPPREKAAAARDALRRSPDAPGLGDAILDHIAQLRPLAPRRGDAAAPFLGLIASAAAAGQEELAAALGLVLRDHVTPLRADGPAGAVLTQAGIKDLVSRRALRRVGAAFRAGPMAEEARRRYARLFPYYRHDREGRRALILNRLPYFAEPDDHFVHNQSNLPHGYASSGVAEGLALDVLFVVGTDFDAVKDQIDAPDVVFNNIGSPETIEMEGLGERIERIAAYFGARLINPPAKLERLSRSGNFDWIGEREHLFFPLTRRFEPGLDPAAAAGAVVAEFQWPVIVRDLIGHMGSAAHRVSSRAECEAALASLSPEGAYVIQYYDYPQWNGLYCRYRLYKIGDEFTPARIHFGRHWNVHSHEHDAMKKEEPAFGLDALENQFWDDPTSLVPAPVWEALKALLLETGLDTVGCDFTMAPDGRALVFEVNSSMHIRYRGRGGFERLCGLDS